MLKVDNAKMRVLKFRLFKNFFLGFFSLFGASLVDLI